MGKKWDAIKVFKVIWSSCVWRMFTCSACIEMHFNDTQTQSTYQKVNSANVKGNTLHTTWTTSNEKKLNKNIHSAIVPRTQSWRTFMHKSIKLTSVTNTHRTTTTKREKNHLQQPHMIFLWHCFMTSFKRTNKMTLAESTNGNLCTKCKRGGFICRGQNQRSK